jgi:hypothetical protein
VVNNSPLKISLTPAVDYIWGGGGQVVWKSLPRKRKVCLRSTLFWDITQRRVVILFRRFGTAYIGPIFKGQEVQELEKKVFFLVGHLSVCLLSDLASVSSRLF